MASARVCPGRLTGMEQAVAFASTDTAYTNVKGTKSAPAPKRTPRRRRKARRGEKRQAVFDVIKEHPEGLTRGEVLQLIGVNGDKSGEQSVSNALSALSNTSSSADVSGIT